MLKCPHCNGKGVPAWRKLFLGPASYTRCRKCKEKVSVSNWAPLLVLFPILFFGLIFFLSSSVTIKTLAVIVGILTMFLMHMNMTSLRALE